jgi:ribosomal-protein-alanine N-acetyltransferase
MKYSIRSMAARDIDQVLALEKSIPEVPHWGFSAYKQRLSENGAGFIAESDGHLLGFSIAKQVVNVCELESIAVTPEARGQGGGKALFHAVVEWAQLRSAVRLELEVRASNHRAIRFYDRMGMRREGLRRQYYSFPEEDAVLMGMPLSTGGKLS